MMVWIVILSFVAGFLLPGIALLWAGYGRITSPLNEQVLVLISSFIGGLLGTTVVYCFQLQGRIRKHEEREGAVNWIFECLVPVTTVQEAIQSVLVARLNDLEEAVRQAESLANHGLKGAKVYTVVLESSTKPLELMERKLKGMREAIEAQQAGIKRAMEKIRIASQCLPFHASYIIERQRDVDQALRKVS